MMRERYCLSWGAVLVVLGYFGRIVVLKRKQSESSELKIEN